MAKNTILDKAGIEAVIVKLGKNTLDNDVQAALLGCIQHIEQHGDITLLNRLYLAVPQGTRKSAITAWVLAHGKVEANADAATKKAAPFKFSRDRTTNMVDGMAKPWYSFKPDNAPDEEFDVVKALAALLNKAGKAKSVKGEDVLTQLKALQGTLAPTE